MKAFAALLASGATLLASSAGAEIVFLPGGQVASAEGAYVYQHPSLRSVVFVSPETRQMSILPPVGPYVLTPPPLLWRSPTAMPLYPPVVFVQGVNNPPRPSNRDMTNYSLQRAHAFGQRLYSRNNDFGIGIGPWWYGYGYGGLGPIYAPPQLPGFNQPARPSNQTMSNYHLERAHRFSMDAYRK